VLFAADVDPEGAELAGPVAKRLPQVVGDIEDERPRVVGLLDDPLYPQGVVGVVEPDARED
jgi:hypothetical protein